MARTFRGKEFVKGLIALALRADSGVAARDFDRRNQRHGLLG